MKCPRCLNRNPEFFYKGSKGWYCRKCISFGRAMLEEERSAVSLEPVGDDSGEYALQYPLTPAQKEISHKCAEAVKESDVLLNCVTGAGKTELVVESIACMMREKKKVCFAIPRRQVVLELQERLAQIFSKAKVIAVCGGHTEETDGDLIVCTTHQLYRYYRAFDLLILDEPDAFPYRGDAVLHGIAKTACRGRRIYLTATPDRMMLKRVAKGTLKELKLSVRPHGHPLPVPVMRTGGPLLRLLLLLSWLRRHAAHPRMVFVPTIVTASVLGRFLSLFDRVTVCTSKTPDRDERISRFRKEGKGIMCSTTIMERGTTVPGVDVCVWRADHGVFDQAGLVQMAGRAGRTFAYPDGDVLFLLDERSEAAEACVRMIREANGCGA